MYKLGCVSGLTLFKFKVLDFTTQTTLNSVFYFDQWGTRTLELNLTAGKVYQVSIDIDWAFGV